MAKQNTQIEDLPTLDDFTESSLLDVVEEEDSDLEEEEDNDSEEEDEEEIENPLDKKIPEKKPKKKPEPADEEESEDEESEEEVEDEEEKDESEGTFWSDVERITGVEVEVDYGNVDPESPEGAALREAALVEKTEQGIWKYIQENFPKSYKALTVEANGGDLSELITPNYVDYSKITIAEDNVAQQKKILMDYYMEVKNLPEKKAIRMVEADEDSDEEDGLYNAAKEALEERKQAQIKRETEVAEKNRREAEARQQQDHQMINYIRAVTDRGEVGNFKLAKADKDTFFNFFISQVNRGPQGGYIFSSPITNENIGSLMEQAYFAFKGGELDKLVQRREETKQVRKLKRNIDNERKRGSSSSTENPREKKKSLPTMDDYID